MNGVHKCKCEFLPYLCLQLTDMTIPTTDAAPLCMHKLEDQQFSDVI